MLVLADLSWPLTRSVQDMPNGVARTGASRRHDEADAVRASSPEAAGTSNPPLVVLSLHRRANP